MIIELTGADLSADPRLEDYTRLKDVRLRSKIEPERGLYMAESANVIERALRAGHNPRSFLMSSRWLESLTPLIEGATGAADGAELPVFVADEDVLEQMTGFHLHRGALAAMQRPVLPMLDELLATARGGEPARRVVVLENLVDHTNVGAAFRSAAALGVDAVLVTPQCADPLYRRSVRVSMGTVFQVPWTRLESWPGDIAALQRAGFTVASLALSRPRTLASQWSWAPKATAWAVARSRHRTIPSRSPWTTASIPSTSRPPPRWSSGPRGASEPPRHASATVRGPQRNEAGAGNPAPASCRLNMSVSSESRRAHG